MSLNIVKLASTVAIAFTVLVSGSGVSQAFTVGGMTREIYPKRSGAHLAVRRDTLPPFTFASFCASQSSQCERRGEGKTIELSREKRAFLQRINMEINQSITYREEAMENDSWNLDAKSGDCEDYAITKRKRLLDAGWPSGALRIATARTAEGIGHAVLVVSTTSGDLVLDNRTNIVKPWFATQLRFIKIQSQEDPRIWQAL